MDFQSMQVCYSYDISKPNTAKMPLLGSDEKKTLKDIAKRFDCLRIGFVFDLYLMIKSRGRALAARTKIRAAIMKLLEPQFKNGQLVRNTVDRVFSRHYGTLQKIRKLSYFGKLCDIPDTYDAVERILAIFQKLSRKTQPSKCNACSLMQQCRFGKQYDTNVQVALGAEPSNYALSYDKDCKEPPELDVLTHAANALAIMAVILDPVQGAALQAMFQEMADKGSSRDAGEVAKTIGLMMKANAIGVPSDSFDASFTGEVLLKGIEEMVDKLTSQQLAIFELARTFNDHLLPEGQEDHKAVDTHEKDYEVRNMKDFDEVSKAMPSEFADDDLFDKKIAYSDLKVRQDLLPQKKKQYYHIILDVSGSMCGSIAPNRYALHFKGSLAQALCLSIIKKVSVEKSMMLFRFFASKPDRLRKADDDDGLMDISRIVALSDFNGGGTDIQSAIVMACDDIIEEEKNGKGKAEILLISDGESHVKKDDLEKALNGHIKLHVIDVSPIKQGEDEYHSASSTILKDLSETYLKVDPVSIDFKDIAKAAGGD